MTALAAARNTKQLGPEPLPRTLAIPVKASTKIWRGSLVVIDAGYAAPARAATGLFAVGRAKATVDNSSGAAGALTVEVEPGIFLWGNSSSGDLIAQADVGKVCYAVDDQTVALTSNSGARSAAGRIIAVDSSGVYVLSGVTFEDGALVTTPISSLAGTLTGTTDGTLANVAAVSTGGGNTYTDATLNGVITDINLQLKELQAKLNAVITALNGA